ncbi:MAG TPA: hypothetical protein DCY27_10390 [Desulfobacterales bacterium]|nr:hypothetical protein [Desulfobacterales bacterium]
MGKRRYGKDERAGTAIRITQPNIAAVEFPIRSRAAPQKPQGEKAPRLPPRSSPPLANGDLGGFQEAGQIPLPPF